MHKQHVALIFGGKSPEHEVSIVSARNIYNTIDTHKYKVSLIGIAQDGRWYLEKPEHHQAPDFRIGVEGLPLFILPGFTHSQIRLLEDGVALDDIDVAFPITHGPNGEDGTLQGLLNQINIPFVGPDVLGSAVAMDKDVCKRLFIQAGIGCAQGVVLHKHLKDEISYTDITKELGDVLFVKPANMGSSIGVSRATDEASFRTAIAEAFLYDTKILVEKAVTGRELECAVLGNEFPQASTIGEIIMEKGFYDFEAKYVSDVDAQLHIPAKNIPEATIEKIRKVAIQAYQCLSLEGLTRVDVFLTPDEEVLVNEVNTLPGFTSISMYPKLWEASGIAYTDLISQLLDLAIARSRRTASLKSSRL